MLPPRPHPDETRRVAMVRALDLLDTANDPELDHLVRLAARVADVPIALLTVVDDDRQWFKARLGLGTPETPRDVSFCGHAILEDEPMVVPDSLQDPRFHDNPLVTQEPQIRFYAGFQVRAHELPIGTLCVIDRVARELTEVQTRTLKSLSREIEQLLELRLRHVALLAQESELHAEAGDLQERLAARGIGPAEIALCQQEVDWQIQRFRLEKQRFCSHVVHDMKTPLAVIVGYADLLRQTLVEADLDATGADDIYYAGQQLNRMTLDLLDTMLAGSGSVALSRTPTCLRRLTLDTLARAEPVARLRDLRLVASVPDDLDAVVDLDPKLVERVILNLIENASTHSPPHSEIEIDLRREGSTLELRVLDRGPGIADAHKSQVFDLYAQLPTNAGRKHGSRGLGLAFCAMVAEAHGGRIDVQDRPGGGSVFCVVFPES